MRPTIVRSDAPNSLLQDIEAIGGLAVCSIMEILQMTNVPFGWDVDRDIMTGVPEDRVEPQESDGLDAILQRFGILGGYCVPVSHPNGGRFAVIYVGIRPESDKEYPDIVYQTIRAFSAFSNDMQRLEPFSVLGALEMLCLEFAGENPDIAWIGGQLGLSGHTIRLALASATRKLNARSFTEASVKLARHRPVHP